MSKSIIKIDHGNHNGDVIDGNKNDYNNCNLFLYHYHFRGVKKLIEKHIQFVICVK